MILPREGSRGFPAGRDDQTDRRFGIGSSWSLQETNRTDIVGLASGFKSFVGPVDDTYFVDIDGLS
jgi:hypothetical protein